MVAVDFVLEAGTVCVEVDGPEAAEETVVDEEEPAPTAIAIAVATALAACTGLAIARGSTRT